MAASRVRKILSHGRIRAAASRLLRRDGANRFSVHRVMEEAGMTVGGFYAHYGSRAELLADAFTVATSERRSSVVGLLDGTADADRLAGFIGRYLSEEHVEDLAGGCPWAAILSDLPRSPSALRATVTTRLEESISRLHPDRRAAIATLAVSFASLILMRSVTTDRLRNEIAGAARFAVASMEQKLDTDGSSKGEQT